MESMKGFQLPINILVVVAIAVIVLLGLVALYFRGFGPFSTTAGIEAVKNEGCMELNPRAGCTTDPETILIEYDVDADGIGDGTDADDNLEAFLNTTYGCGLQAEYLACVKRICACPGY